MASASVSAPAVAVLAGPQPGISLVTSALEADNDNVASAKPKPEAPLESAVQPASAVTVLAGPEPGITLVTSAL